MTKLAAGLGAAASSSGDLMAYRELAVFAAAALGVACLAAALFYLVAPAGRPRGVASLDE